jgi:hypothetical protein
MIIEYPSGITYEAQTGGNLCRQSKMEGVFMLIGNDFQDDWRLVGPMSELYEYFAGPPFYGEGAIGGLAEEHAAFIDAILRKYRISPNISVDRSRLAESDEAWVYVTISGEEDTEHEFKTFAGFGPYPRSAVLTWANSD